jgi:hypothetical protein
MTKMLKVEMYVIPFNDMKFVDNDILMNYIKNGTVDDIGLHFFEIEETDIGDFNDDHKLNRKAEVWAFRKYFEKPDMRIKRVGILGGRLKQQALDAGFKENDIVLVTTKLDTGFPVFDLEKVEGSPVEWLQNRFLNDVKKED